MCTSSKKQMAPEALAVGVIVASEGFSVCFSDGRMLHWPEIDEDIEVRHIVEGRMPVKEGTCVSAVAEPRGTYRTR